MSLFIEADAQESGPSAKPERVSLKHIEARGIGYNQGYTSLDGFFASLAMLDSNWVPFLDLRAHVFNDGNPDINAGIGARYLKSSRTWGANVYYDYRKTGHFHYNQVGVGLETLGKIWDFRINGYFPVGEMARSYHFKFHEFDDHYMILSNKKEFAMTGGNAEVGAHAYHRDGDDFDVYAAAGPYCFNGEGRTAWGGEGRILLTVFDHLGVQLSGSYDTVFKGIVQGEVSLSFSWGGKKKGKKSSREKGSLSSMIVNRALQSVDRQEIIVVDRKREKSKAIDPDTGKPYTFWFVDNTSHSQGTFDSPFNTLSAAEAASNANDIIYVFAGDGTDNGMSAGITLKSGQQLLGAGIAQKISTTHGRITVPAQGNGYPVISNFNDPSGMGVKLVNGNNVLSGLYLKDRLGIPEGSLFSTAVTIENGSNYLIQNNLLSSFSTGSCISVYGPGDRTSIVNNTFICTNTLNACTGIFFYDVLTPVTGTFNIENNLFKGAGDGSGFNDAIGTFGPGTPLGVNSKVAVNITSNTFVSQTNNGLSPTAIDFTAENAALFIEGNYIDVSELTDALAGIYLEQDSTAKLFTASLSDNTTYTAPGVPGYDFNNTTGISSVMIIELGANNVGISVGP